MTTERKQAADLTDLAITLRLPDWREAARSFRSVEGVRALAVLAGGIALLVEPSSARLHAVVIAAVLGLWAAGEVATSRSAGTDLTVARVVLMVVVAAALLLWPSPTLKVVAGVTGGGLIANGGIGAVRTIRYGADDRYLELAGRVLTLALGFALLLVPDVLLRIVVVLVGVLWVLAGGLRIANLISPRSDRTPTLQDGVQRGLRWLRKRSQAPDDRAALFVTLFYEGDEVRARLGRFLALMAFSTTIAAWGVTTDSTAVVIGAMLIAPLITPLMATALSVTMGWPRRTVVSMLVAIAGVAVTVGLSAMIGVTIPYEVPLDNPQIASRVAPTLADLFIALAAGGAGAFALSRRDVSDALPGVAVAIALVPPLAVAGLTLQAGEGTAAAGAMLLFTTNLVAILLAGALVFVLTGVVPLEQLSSNQRWIKSTLAIVAAVAVLVVVPLSLSGQRILAESFDRQTAQETVEAWLGTGPSEIRELSVGRDAVFVRIAGPDEPADVSDLADDLAGALGRDVDVVVRWTPEVTIRNDAEQTSDVGEPS